MPEPTPVQHTFYDVPVTTNGHFICNYVPTHNNIHITSAPAIKCRTGFRNVSVSLPDDAPGGLAVTTTINTSGTLYTASFGVALPITEETRKDLRFYRGTVTCNVQTMGTQNNNIIIEPVTLQFNFPITFSFEPYPLKPITNGWPGDISRAFGVSYTVRNETMKLLKTYMIADKEDVMRDKNYANDPTPTPESDIRVDIYNPSYWSLNTASYGITATSDMSGLAGVTPPSPNPDFELNAIVKFEAPGLIFNLEHTYMPGTVIVIDTNNQLKHKTCYTFQTYDSVAYNNSIYNISGVELIGSGSEFVQNGTESEYTYRYWSVTRQANTWYLKHTDVDIAIPNDCSAEPVDRVSPPNLGWPCGIIFSDASDRLVSITNPFDPAGMTNYTYDYAEKGKYEGLPFFEINLKAPATGQPPNPDYIVGAGGLMPVQTKIYRYLHAHIVGDDVEWVLTNNFTVTADTPRVNIQDTTSTGVPYGWPANSTYGQYIVNDIVLTSTTPDNSSTDIFSVNHIINGSGLALIATDIGDSFVTETGTSSAPAGLCGGVWSYYPACRTLPVFKGINEPHYTSNSTVTYTRVMTVNPDSGFSLSGYRHHDDTVAIPDPPSNPNTLDTRYFLLTAGDSPNSNTSTAQGGGVKATGLMMCIPAYEISAETSEHVSVDDFAPPYLGAVLSDALNAMYDEDLFVGVSHANPQIRQHEWNLNDPATLVSFIGLQPALMKGFTGTYSDTISVPFTGSVNNAINNASDIIQNAAIISSDPPTRNLVLDLNCEFTSDVEDDNDLYKKICITQLEMTVPKTTKEKYTFTCQSCTPVIKKSEASLSCNDGYRNSPAQSNFPLDITEIRPFYVSRNSPIENYDYAVNQSAVYYTLASGYVLSNTKNSRVLTGLERGPYGRFSIAEASLRGLYNIIIHGSYIKPVTTFEDEFITGFEETTGTFDCKALDYVDIKAYAPTPSKIMVDASDNVTISPAASKVVHTYKQCIRKIFKRMDYAYRTRAAESTGSWGGFTTTRTHPKYLYYKIIITHISIAESLNSSFANNYLRAETIVSLQKKKAFGVIRQAATADTTYIIEAAFDPDGSKYDEFKTTYGADFQAAEFDEIIERKATEHGVYPEFTTNSAEPNTTRDILIIEAQKQVGNLFYEFTDTMTTEIT